MAINVTRGTKAATTRDRRIAQQQLNLLADELPRIRSTALAWRNGIGALLAGLVGFGLLRGRSDVTQLTHPWDAIVGGLLALSLAAGGVAAVKVLRAAHGSPRAVNARRQTAAAVLGPAGNADRVEALIAARALYRGVILSFVCALLLVGAVGMTWYGPAKASPRILVVTVAGPRCGSVEQLEGGVLTLQTGEGRIEVDLAQASGLRAVEHCPTAAAP